MWDTLNNLQYENNYNHWKMLDLFLDLNYFSFSNATQTLTPHTYLHTKPWALIISFVSVFDMQNSTLCMRIWREVRNFASQKFRLTPAWQLPLCELCNLHVSYIVMFVYTFNNILLLPYALIFHGLALTSRCV